MARKTILRHKDIIVASCLGALDIAGVVLLQVMLVTPATSAARLAGAKIAESVKKLEKNVASRRKLEKTEQLNHEIRSSLSRFDKRVPVKSGVAALFADVLRSADQNGLRILQTQPKESTILGQGFYRFPYELDVQGDYHAAGRFLSLVESHASFMHIVRVDLTAADGDSVRLKVLLYLYGTAEEPTGKDKEASTLSSVPARKS